MYCIEFMNPVLNHSDVIGWNLETGEAGVWSGLFGNKAFFLLRSDANKFLKILKAKGIKTEQMTIIKI